MPEAQSSDLMDSKLFLVSGFRTDMVLVSNPITLQPLPQSLADLTWNIFRLGIAQAQPDMTQCDSTCSFKVSLLRASLTRRQPEFQHVGFPFLGSHLRCQKLDRFGLSKPKPLRRPSGWMYSCSLDQFLEQPLGTQRALGWEWLKCVRVLLAETLALALFGLLCSCFSVCFLFPWIDPKAPLGVLGTLAGLTTR